MYDRFIERLAKSKYKDNFILKGGFFLSTFFGVENRTTMDIDTAFKNANFKKETIEEIIRDVVNIDIGDNTKLKYLGIEHIRDEDEYGGFRVGIEVKIENIRERFHIDIATGDSIVPKEIEYRYYPILKDDYLNIWAYNMETVLAEKIETILSRAELNGRMRDFYDIYLIYVNYWENINIEHLKNSIIEVFKNREFKGNYFEILNIIKNSDILKSRWKVYQKKYDYAKNIDFSKTIEPIETILNIINKC